MVVDAQDNPNKLTQEKLRIGQQFRRIILRNFFRSKPYVYIYILEYIKY